MTKKILIICLFSIGFLLESSNKLFATHAAGGELTYEWVSDSTYHFIFKFYRDCSGVNEPNSVDFCYSNPCSGSTYSTYLNKMFTTPSGGSNGLSVSTGCPGNPTSCNGGTIPGYKEWWYEQTITLPARCANWEFHAFIPSRNNGITNLISASTKNLYVQATLNNLVAQGNSSPYFTNPPVPYVCIGQPFSYNNGTVENNGDSLVFESIQPLNGGCTGNAVNINYSSGTYNVNNPFACTNTFSCNSGTGTVSFTASSQQIVVVTVKCKEYRNGVLIGSVMRDIQIVIRNCNIPVPNQNLIQSSIVNANFNTSLGYLVQPCHNNIPLQFCFLVTSTNPAAILVPSDNHVAALLGSSVSYTNVGTDSVVGCISWLPSLSDTGLNFLVVNVKDSTCSVGSPFIATNTLTIPLFIGNYIGVSPPTVTNVINCSSPNSGSIASNVASSTSPLVYTLLPNNISNNTGAFNNLSAGMYTLTVSDASTCTQSTTFAMIVPNAPIFDSVNSKDVTCNANNGVVYAFVSGGIGSITIHLLPTAQSNSTGVFTGLSAGAYTLVAIDANGCSNSTIVNVGDVPTPNIMVSFTSLSCNLDTTSIIANGINSPAQPFTFSINGGGFSTNSAFVNISAGTYTIALKDTNLCTTDTTVTIVDPLPIVITSVTTTSPSCVPGVDGSLQINAVNGQGAIVYSIDNGLNFYSSNIFNNLSAGTYSIVVRDAKICSTSSVVVINNLVPPTIALSTYLNSTCSLANGNIQVVGIGGNGVLQYSINPAGSINSSGFFSSLTANSYTLSVVDSKGCSNAITKVISTSPLPIINSINSTPNTCGLNNGNITAIAFSGTGTLNYSLNSITNQTGLFVGLSNAFYLLTVSDANNCIATSNVIVQNLPSPSFYAISTPIYCFDGSNSTIIVTAATGSGVPVLYSLNGSTYQTANTFSNNSFGNYTISVKDTNNCITSDTLAIAQPTQVQLQNIITSIPTCNPGNDATITFNAIGGVGGYTYQLNFSAPQSNAVFNNLSFGNYTIQAADINGCSATALASIIAPSPPIFSSSIASNEICDRGDGSISATAIGGTGAINYTLLPSTTNASGNFTNLSAGNYTINAIDANNCITASTVTVGFTNGPSLAGAITTPNTCSQNNGTITAIASGGTGILTYAANSSTNYTGVFIGLSNATYQVTVTDANTCSTSTNVVVLNAPSPIITLAADTILCFGGTSTITATLVSGASAPIAYNMNGGAYQASPIFTNNSFGTYTIGAKDSNNCITTQLITIAQPALLVINSATNTIPTCSPGADAAITINASGGSGVYAYSLNGGLAQTANIITGLSAGLYNIIVSDANNCSASTNITITVPNSPMITSSIASNEICDRGDGSISATAIGGTGAINYTLLPSTTNASGNFTNLSAGNYTINAIDANNCITASTVTVGFTNGPSLAGAITTPNTCSQNNGTITAIASGGTGILTYAANSSTNFTGVFTGLSNATYQVTVTDANTCSTSTNVVVLNAPSPIITLAADTILCFGGTSTITAMLVSGASVPIAYNMNGGAYQASLIFTNNSFGTYTIGAKDSNNCITTQLITIAQPALLVINSATNTIPTCSPGADAAITINASGGSGVYAYSLNGGLAQTANIITGLSAGLYNIIVSDANNCSASANTTITVPNSPMITSSIASNEICDRGDGSISATAIGGTGAINYTLLPSTTNASGNFTNLSAGIYTINAIDANNCITTTTVTVGFTNGPSLAGANTTPNTCSQNNGTITAIASGGTGILTYAVNSSTNYTGVFTGLSNATYQVTVTDANTCSTTTNVIVLNAPSPIITLAADTILCFGGTSTITAMLVSGASVPITYNMNGGAYQASPIFTNNLSGTFTIGAKDTNNCLDTSIVAIPQPNQLQVISVTNTIPTCNPGNDASIAVNVNGGSGLISCNLNFGIWQTNPTFNGLVAGTYTVNVKDANNCTAFSTVSITVPNSPNFSSLLVANDTCVKQVGGIHASIVGGSGSINYVLQPNAINNNTGIFSGLSANNYTIVASDFNNCTTSTTVNITALVGPSITSTSFTNNTCGYNNGSITVTAFGSLPITFNNTLTSNTSGIFNGLVGNNYIVTVSDVYNCTAATSIQIQNSPSPVLTLSANPILCNGNLTTILTNVSASNAMPFLFQINNGGWQFIDSFSNINSGTYNIVVADTNNCRDTAQVVLSQPPILSVQSISATVPTCNPGNDAQLAIAAIGGVPVYNYSLNGGANQLNNSFLNLGVGSYTIVVSDANNCTESSSITINSPAVISIDSFKTSLEFCNPVANGSATIFASGGTGLIQYSLGAATQVSNNFTSQTSGLYIATISDAKNCTASTNISITHAANPIFDTLTNSNILCYGQTNATIYGLVTGVGTMQYQLLPNGTSNNSGVFSSLNAGIYTLEATDSFGCKIDSTIIITQPNPLVFSNLLVSNTPCFGSNNGVINAIASGGNAGYLYTVLPINVSNTSGIFTNLLASSYTLHATDTNACYIDSIITISEPNAIMLNLDSVMQIKCANNPSGYIKVVASGGIPMYQYTIQPGNISNTTGVFTNLSAGNYSISVVDNNLCVTTVYATITSPSVLSFNQPVIVNNICFGDANGSINTTAQGGTGTFVFTLMPASSSNSSGLFTSLLAGTYTVEVTDANGCTSSTIASVLQGAKIIFDSIILQNPICRNDSNGKIIIYASGGQSPFLYATNTNAFSVNNKFLNQITGIYALHLKDANGCLADSTISIQPKNLFSVAVKVITPVTCVDVPNGGFTIALTATDTTINYIYQLSPTSVINVNGVFTNLQDGTYIVTVRDANGCEETTVGTIVDNSNPISVSFITKNVTCYGVDPLGAITANVIGGFSPYYFQWNNDSVLNKNYLQNISAGTYTLQITDFNNCAFQDTVTVVSAPCCQLYIPNSFSPNDDGVNDVFIPITNATVTKYSFTIYNRWGNRVFFTSDISRGWDGKTKGLKSDVDTYFYLIDYYCPYSDKTYQLKGDVTLVK